MDYKNGRIYKITNDVNNDIYIGSTTQRLCQRMATHRNNSKKYPNRKIYKFINSIGIEHFKILLIEKYPCSNREELNEREEHYRRLLKPILNNNCCHIDDYTNYWNKKVQCESCGGTYTRSNKHHHKVTDKHIKSAPQ